MPEVGILEVDSTEVGGPEVDTREVDISEVGIRKVDATEIGAHPRAPGAFEKRFVVGQYSLKLFLRRCPPLISHDVAPLLLSPGMVPTSRRRVEYSAGDGRRSRLAYLASHDGHAAAHFSSRIRR